MKKFLLIFLFFSSQILAMNYFDEKIEEQKKFAEKLPLKFLCVCEIAIGLDRDRTTRIWKAGKFEPNPENNFFVLIAKSDQLRPEQKSECETKANAHKVTSGISSIPYLCMVKQYLTKEKKNESSEVEFCHHTIRGLGDSNTRCGSDYIFFPDGTYISTDPAYFADYGQVSINKGTCLSIPKSV